MENSEVLDQQTTEVPADGKVQKDVDAINAEAPAVLEQSTGSQPNNKVEQPVGEQNHASNIASNTYNYDSQASKTYNEKVTTITGQSNGKTLSTAWDSKYGMNKDYTVNDSEDYTWNKLASEMAQLSYDQEAAQYRADSIVAKQEIDKAASSAWNNYFAAEYSARQTQDKMGWSGGQKQASDLQVEFLKAETAANMYTQDEMQRYGVNSKLSIARMYADANQRSLALEYYQDAIDTAISEANLTGYYVPPEASEMFIQEGYAQEILNNPNSTPEQIKRAQNVQKNCQAFYDELGFEKGYAYKTDKNGDYVLDEHGEKIVVTEYTGIKTLATLQHEHQVNQDKINEDLQRQSIEVQKYSNYLQEIRIRDAQLEQNRIMTDKISQSQDKFTSSSDTDFYVGTDGKTHKLDPGTQLYRVGGEDSGQIYFIDHSEDGYGQAVRVYNSNEEFANANGKNYMSEKEAIKQYGK